eukprot:gnl/TRDRNA2_/TRDRNA2_72772_c0_seq1.p1 gnl/TRDRNA2_/TRDRNA2_72772_c0~~gnl/TRDRNA2_/TRDRNA2_72772_c0_seq1.p1  ORF type:complete len:187 (+),score=20.01 gnl/TRDRNA2_/TRDRNA2_72772_c0_seq1:132-692(+)
MLREYRAGPLLRCLPSLAAAASCDWTMVPHTREGMSVEKASDGAPTSWRLGSLQISRTYSQAGPKRHPCWDQTLHFAATPLQGSSQVERLAPSQPHAVVIVGNETTLLGGGQSSWTLVHRQDDREEYVRQCTDGTVAKTVVSEEHSPHQPAWSRRIRMLRFCPGVWTHMAVNIAAVAPIDVRWLSE